MTAVRAARPQTDPHGGGGMFLRNDDRWREDRIAGELCRTWGLHLWHMPPWSPVDFLAVRHGRPVGWVEVISRSKPSSDLLARGGVALKAATHAILCALGGVPLSPDWFGAVIVYDLPDGLFWAPIDPAARLAEGRLTDPRGAPGDTAEPVVFFADLRRVGKGARP